MQKISSDSSIINYVHSLPVISRGKGKKFDLFVSNDVVGVHISNYFDILEIISYFRSDPFTLIYLDLPANSYMIACTNTQNFVEEGENCASTISVGHLEPLFHTIGYYMNLFGYYMTLFGLIFKFQEPPIMLVAVLINFGVKNQVPQVSFKIVVGDLMSFFSHEFANIIFCGSLDIFEAISY